MNWCTQSSQNELIHGYLPSASDESNCDLYKCPSPAQIFHERATPVFLLFTFPICEMRGITLLAGYTGPKQNQKKTPQEIVVNDLYYFYFFGGGPTSS